MFSAPAPIISGMPYTITEIDGSEPHSIDDFARDEASFAIDLQGMTYRVAGDGARRGEGVRFHEKDVSADGKDIRIWNVSRREDGRFIAEHDATF